MAQSVAVIERVEDKLGLYFIPPGEKAMQWILCSLEIGPINAGIERKDRDDTFSSKQMQMWTRFVNGGLEEPSMVLMISRNFQTNKCGCPLLDS